MYAYNIRVLLNSFEHDNAIIIIKYNITKWICKYNSIDTYVFLSKKKYFIFIFCISYVFLY